LFKGLHQQRIPERPQNYIRFFNDHHILLMLKILQYFWSSLWKIPGPTLKVLTQRTRSWWLFLLYWWLKNYANPSDIITSIEMEVYCAFIYIACMMLTCKSLLYLRFYLISVCTLCFNWSNYYPSQALFSSYLYTWYPSRSLKPISEPHRSSNSL